MSITKTTITVYPYSGDTSELTIPFDYLKREFVVVSLAGTGKQQKALKLGTDYRFATKTTIIITRQYQPDEGYDKVIVRRVTDASKRIINYQDGSILNASELNTSQLQSLHVAEEARDLANYTLFVDDNNNLDARGRRIINVGDPINPQDVVTKKYIDNAAGGVIESRDKALQYRNEAEKFRNEAEKFKNTAEASAKEIGSKLDQAIELDEQAISNSAKAIEAMKNAQVSAKEAQISNENAKSSALNAKKAEDATRALLGNLIGCSSIADLRNIIPTTDKQVVEVVGYYEGSDEGGGLFYYDEADKSNSDNGATIIVGSLGSRWKRMYKDSLNVKECGAKGDGVTDDINAFDLALRYSKVVKVPKGTYYVSRPIKTPNGYTWNNTESQGVTIEGVGIDSIITRKQPNVIQSETEQEYCEQACLNIQGSYCKIANLQFKDSPIGVFMGQNLQYERNNYCSFNKLDSLVFTKCGTGFLASASGGNTYNHFVKLHFISCQLGFRTFNGRFKGPQYFNRNYIANCRATRCYIGLFLKDADTNTVISFHCEGINSGSPNLSYPEPLIYPRECGDSKYIGHLIYDSVTNCFNDCMFETTTVTLISKGVGNTYIGNYYREDSASTVKFIDKPAVFISTRTTVVKGLTYLSNIRSDIEGRAGVSNVGNIGYDSYRNSTQTGETHSYKITKQNVVPKGSFDVPLTNYKGRRTHLLSFDLAFGNNPELFGGRSKGTAIFMGHKSSNTIVRHKMLESNNVGYGRGGGTLEPSTITFETIPTGGIKFTNNTTYHLSFYGTMDEVQVINSELNLLVETYLNKEDLKEKGVYKDFRKYLQGSIKYLTNKQEDPPEMSEGLSDYVVNLYKEIS